MTVVLSIAAWDMIIMAADSAVTRDFGDSRKYEQGRKSYKFPGIGCVTAWGARDGNQIGLFLENKLEEAKHPSVNDLAILTQEYLKKEYRPDERDLDDVGYHVAGFDQNTTPKLFHIFWGFDRPRPQGQTTRSYKVYDHSPHQPSMYFLYNGRNDLAFVVVNTLLREIGVGGDTKLNPENPIDRVLLTDLTLRFASEITPQVSPPFLIFMITKTNDVAVLRNDLLTPLSPESVTAAISKASRTL